VARGTPKEKKWGAFETFEKILFEEVKKELKPAV